MRSDTDAKRVSMPSVLPHARASNSLSLSNSRMSDGRAASLAPSTSPLPPRMQLQSLLPNVTLNSATSSRPSADTRDVPLLDSLAHTDIDLARSTSQTYYLQYKESVAENAQLRAALRQHELDAVQVVQFLENKLKEMQEEAVAYKTGITQVLEDHRTAEAALQEKYGDIVRERDAELARYAAITAKLHDDLQQASRYVQQRQEHAAELQQLQEQLSDLAASHEKELAALHFQTVDRKLKLVALEKAMRSEFDALVEARATKALEERFQGVLERTRNLEGEKMSLTHHLQDLMQLTAQLDAERVQVRREVAVQQQAQKELKNHALVRGRLKDHADLKAHQLEERLREVTGQHKRQMADVQAQYEARIAALQDEVKATRSSLQSHRAELQQMRQLTAKVVGERSELENFFHTALADCQRYRHAMGTTTAGTAATSRGGTLTEKVEWGSSSGNNGNAALATSTFTSSVGAASLKNNGAFFEELSWKDKEKVIKSLLFFLNANYYKSSPTPEGAAAQNV